MPKGTKKILYAVDANIKAEGLSVSAKVKNDCRAMLDGKISANQLVAKYITQYKK